MVHTRVDSSITLDCNNCSPARRIGVGCGNAFVTNGVPRARSQSDNGVAGLTLMPCQESSDVEEFIHTHTFFFPLHVTCYMILCAAGRWTRPKHLPGLGVIPADPWAILLARAACAGPHAAAWEEKSGQWARSRGGFG